MTSTELETKILRDEVERLTKALHYEQHLLTRLGTHGPGCWSWGPAHYECALALLRLEPKQKPEVQAETEYNIGFKAGWEKGWHYGSMVENSACARILDQNAQTCANNSMLQDVLNGNAAAIRARSNTNDATR